jgi:hypothetical protein
LAIWRADERKTKPPYFSGQEIELLEHRVANLETIISNDDSYLNQKIQCLESDVTAEVRTQVNTPENKA